MILERRVYECFENLFFFSGICEIVLEKHGEPSLYCNLVQSAANVHQRASKLKKFEFYPDSFSVVVLLSVIASLLSLTKFNTITLHTFL